MPKNSPVPPKGMGDIVKSKQFIPVYLDLVRLLKGDHICAIYFAQLLFYDKRELKTPGGYFQKKKSEIKADTLLTRFQQDRARDKLVNGGMIHVITEGKNGYRNLYFRIVTNF